MSKVPTQIQLSQRAFFDDDLDDLVEIEIAAGDASWSRRSILHATNQVSIDTRVITGPESDDPVAFYTVEHGDENLYICNIAVHPDWRRQGVASFALIMIEDLGRDLNYRRVVLDVQEQNLPAQLLYRKNHYVVEQIRKKHYENQDGYRMVKQLR